MRQLALCSIGMLLSLAPAQAQVGDRIAGTVVARGWCANCHEVGMNARPTAADAAPPFAAVARMPSTTEMSLRVFLQTPHANMPDYQLSRRELEDVIAYILSLRRD